MAVNTRNLQTVKHGLEIKYGSGIIQVYAEEYDPSIVGVVGNIGSLYLRSNGSTYKKIGSMDTDWVDTSSNVSFGCLQENHGFELLTPVYFNLSTFKWEEAIASDLSTVGSHVVVDIIDANEIRLGQSGSFAIDNSKSNGVWYTSDSVPGETVQQSPIISNPMYLVANDIVYLLNYRAVSLATSSSSYAFGIDCGNPSSVHMLTQIISCGDPASLHLPNQVLNLNL